VGKAGNGGGRKREGGEATTKDPPKLRKRDCVLREEEKEAGVGNLRSLIQIEGKR